MSSESHAGRAGRRMEVASLTALLAGAAGSVALTLYAALRVGSPPVLLVLFAGWVGLPFAIFSIGHLLSRRRSGFVQRVYGRSLLLASTASVVAYAAAALGPARPKTAVFVLVAPLSLLVLGLVVPIVLFVSRRRS